MSDYMFVWELLLDYCGHKTSVTYVASEEFDKALAAGKELIIKKFPNTLKDSWPDDPWHPDYIITGILRGIELSSEEVAL